MFLFISITFISILYYDFNNNFYDRIYNSIKLGTNYLTEIQESNGLFNITDLEFEPQNTRAYSQSYILYALAKIKNRFPSLIDPQNISLAQNFLISIQSNNSCWRFDNDIPPDADDTSLALLSLIESHYTGDLSNSFNNLTLVKFPSGNYNFWLINYSDWEGQYQILTSTVITGTILYALYSYNLSKYRSEIGDSISLLEINQTSEGNWIADYWYLEYYTTYIMSRIISLIKPNSISLINCYNHLIKNQNDDGSWGSNDTRKDLDTSLALLTLLNLERNKFISYPFILRGIEYLLNNQRIDGSWRSVVIWMDPGFISYYYRSKAITTAFCLMALTEFLNLN